MKLYQFYTKPSVAKACYRFTLAKLERLGIKAPFFVEPSAGEGVFLDLLPPKRRIGLDIAPKGKGIKKHDFFTWQYKGMPRERVVVIGNPPFGRRAKLAIEFFNKAATFADTIAFVLPVHFKKYSAQSKLDSRYRLIGERMMPKRAFRTADGKDFHVNCVFQVWTCNEAPVRNKRIRKPLPIAHPHFEIYQYNNTKEALKVFKYDFDFGVPRQGYENYHRRETDVRRMELNKQWALFKAYDARTKKNLRDLDFEKIARKNTVVPGFGKADVVEAYKKKYKIRA